MLERLIEELVARELDTLLERKRAQPKIMYHGTNSVFLPKIFQLGMVPNPTKGKWKGDDAFEQTSVNSPSLHSLEGSYWTDNVMTAYSAARDALRGTDGQRMIVIAQIVPQTAKADEDDVRTIVESAFKASYRDHLGARDLELAAPMIHADMVTGKEMYNDIVDTFCNLAHDRMKTSDKMPMDKNLLKDTFDAALFRILGHLNWSDSHLKWKYIEAYEYSLGKHTDDWEKAKEESRKLADNMPKFNKVAGEKQFLEMLDKISSRYRKYAMPPTDDEWRLRTNLRVTEPVGFSGRNKIVGIIVGGDAKIGEDKKLRLVYGNVPEKFIKDFAQSWSPNFEIIDRKGNVIYSSITAESVQSQVDKLVREVFENLDEDLETRQSFVKDLEESPESRAAFASDLSKSNIYDSYEENIPRGRHVTDTKEMVKIGREFKKLFHKYADQQWLSSLTTVHWMGVTENLERLFREISGKDELSCAAYEKGKFPATEFLGWIGLVIKGRITLLANEMDDLYSGTGRQYVVDLPQHRTKSSGVNKGVGRQYPSKVYSDEQIFVLDKNDWKGSLRNEALVDNWKPIAVIYKSDFFDEEELVAFRKQIAEAGLDIPLMSEIEAAKVF